ncbi:MAG TPA: lysophospholipid acyltransferase family protein [Verrucomicrobiae bacterium]|nr:lysophospholipid acyltransferase family protein [Verrucomicrobiae bacterium]
MKKPIRIGVRLIRVLALFLFAYLDFNFRLRLFGRASSIRARADWLQTWSRRFLGILRGSVTFRGNPPSRGILVSNHLSYIDVLVLGSLQPLVLVSKSEVRSWPVIGPLTACAGTLYIHRQSRTDVARLNEEMTGVVNSGVIVALFPEGTSSDGSQVLPFRSSLFGPAEEHHWPVTPAWIHYTLKEGSVADEVCYWRDMTFFPHLLNLLSKKSIEAFVSFGTPIEGKMDRKEMARELHSRVCALKEAHLSSYSSVATSRRNPPGIRQA